MEISSVSWCQLQHFVNTCKKEKVLVQISIQTPERAN